MRQHLPWLVTAVAVSVAGVVMLRSRGAPDAISSPRSADEHDDAPETRIASAVVPIPAAKDVDPRKVELGKRLFSEARLSKDGTVSCATCHDLAGHGGADGLRVSRGVGGAEGDVNAPTVLNARFNFKQFWDGRAENLEEQVEGPLLHPKEMASGWPEVLALLAGDSAYASGFHDAYADGITRKNVKDAIAEYERSLVTPNSRFDRFLRGDKTALSADEQAGWALFQELGCITCHQGVNLGGNSFQAFGVAGDYFADRGDEKPSDQGRFNVTKNPRDRHRFKVPTLRNVALTAPYFHDGGAATLEDAVATMARYQLGFALEPAEVAKLVTFLKALTGDKPDGK